MKGGLGVKEREILIFENTKFDWFLRDFEIRKGCVTRTCNICQIPTDDDDVTFFVGEAAAAAGLMGSERVNGNGTADQPNNNLMTTSMIVESTPKSSPKLNNSNSQEDLNNSAKRAGYNRRSKCVTISYHY